MKKKYAKSEDVAELVEQVNGEVLKTQDMVRAVQTNLSKEFHETEGRLLAAIRGLEFGKQDFEVLQQDVRDLGKRVGELEKKRGSRR